MDFLNKAVNAYQQSQGGNHSGQQNEGNNQEGGDFGVTGGSRFNAPAGQGQNTMRVSQAGADLDDDDIVNNADRDSGDSGTRDMFGTAMSFLKSGQADDDDDVDEHAVTKAHEKAYSQGNAADMSAKSMGAAAAMQAFKRFTGGNSAPQAASGQNSLISMAMSEASKLFDQQGGSGNAQKQDVVNSAAATVMKLLIKSQLSGAMGTGGGAAGGGMGQLLSMASKFM